MIDIDPRQYLPESYLVRCTCPKCKLREHVPLSKVASHHCSRCKTSMDAQAREDLKAFERFIA